jgi:hypothetical protein
MFLLWWRLIYRCAVWIYFTYAAIHLARHLNLEAIVGFVVATVLVLSVQLDELTDAVKTVRFENRTVINAPNAELIDRVNENAKSVYNLKGN